MSSTKPTVQLEVDSSLQEYVRIGKMGGAQKKAEIARQYESRGRRYFIKSSLDYPADDAIEVVASSLMQGLIPAETNPNPQIGALIAPARFAISTEKTEKQVYVRSEAFPSFTQLVDIKGVKWLGLRSDDPVMIPMFGANPLFGSNKRRLVSFLLDDADSPLTLTERSRLRRELSQLLVSAYLVGDYDVQPKNIGLYRGEDGKFHFCKIDHGWAFANLGKAKYLEEKAAVKPIDARKAVIAKKATHAKGAVPTNHFNDYPDITSSKEFKEVVREMTSGENLARLTENIQVALENIDKLPDDKKLTYYQLLANHMGLQLRYQDASGNALHAKTRSELIALMLCAAKEQIASALLHIVTSRALALHHQQFPGESPKATILDDHSEFASSTTPSTPRPDSPISSGRTTPRGRT